MHRFLISPDSIVDGIVNFSEEDAKHMIKILRHRPGDTVSAFDGSGKQYDIFITSVKKDDVKGKITNIYSPETEAGTKVILFQGVPKNDKMDWIVQKTVELGISKIVPMITQYSVVKAKEMNNDPRTERWNRIAREACKQSGRVAIPEVSKPVKYYEALKQWSNIVNTSEHSCLAIYCYEKEGKKCLKDLLKCYNINCVSTIGLFIGSEGGFSSVELQLAVDHNISPVSLGKRILRTETAPVAVLSVIMYEMGEWNI